jgi:mono/diheme cytochrome c family protein
MMDTLVLGLFGEVTEAADAIEQLRGLGLADHQITVMSGTPYEPEMLARPRAQTPLRRIVALGAVLGLLVALFLTAGIFVLYPLIQDGQPLIPVPPSLIIVFEVVMLGTMGMAFLGFLFVNRFPAFGNPMYDRRITRDAIGVLVEVSSGLAESVEAVFRDNRARDIESAAAERQVSLRSWATFGALVTAILLIGAGVSLLFFYNVIRIPFPSQMVNQDSIAYEQGPRLAAPAAAVPIQGPVLIGGWPASEPIPATADSLQRGQVLFGIHCALCHGEAGAGDGPLAKYFTPRPDDLADEEVQDLPDDVLFLILTQGRGLMPSLAENLGPTERWDTINYVRSLKGTGGG